MNPNIQSSIYNTSTRCERSEQQSRAQRVIASTSHKTPDPFRHHKDPIAIHQAILEYQFKEIFQPHWFGSILWQPWITEYTTAVKETTHFRNKTLTALMKTKLKKLPSPPDRPRIIFFHEKSLVNINPNEPNKPRYKTAYHTHFHLEQCPEPYTSWIQLDWLIRHQVAQRFHRFSTNNSSENKGFVLKPWIKEHHAHYNLKDYYRYKYQQDSDLVLDIINSDLQFHRD